MLEEKEKHLGLIPLIPNAIKRGFNLTKSLGKTVFFIGLINLVLFFLVLIMSGLFPSFRTILYFLGFLPVLASRLVFPQDRIDFCRDSAHHYLDYVFIGIVAIVGVTLVVSIVIDIFAMIALNASLGIRNEKIKTRNAYIIYANEGTLEEWRKTTEYKTAVSGIDVLNQEIQKCNQRINSNHILHTSFKNQETVGRLVYYLERGEARDLTDAIKWMRTLDNQEAERVERLQELQRQTRASEIAAEYSRQAAHNSNLAAHKAGEARDFAELTAWITVIDVFFDD